MAQMTPEEILIHAVGGEKPLMLRSREKDPRLVKRGMSQNKILFRVHHKATKQDIRRAVETKFSVKVEKVNTHHTKEGKIAFVKLRPEYAAEELADRVAPF